MRYLIDVIDQIIEIAPDLQDEFASLRESTLYTAPELMPMRWNMAATILNQRALNHPKRDAIAKIFSGTQQVHTTGKQGGSMTIITILLSVLVALSLVRLWLTIVVNYKLDDQRAEWERFLKWMTEEEEEGNENSHNPSD